MSSPDSPKRSMIFSIKIKMGKLVDKVEVKDRKNLVIIKENRNINSVLSVP